MYDIRNNKTGENISWILKKNDTNGEFLSFYIEIDPNGFVPIKHIHLHQDENFEIISGVLNLECDNEKIELHENEKYIVKKGVSHYWRNNSSTVPVKAIVTFKPSLNTEDFLIEIFKHSNNGNIKKDGSPKLIDGILMCNKYQIYDARYAIWLQKLISIILTKIVEIIILIKKWWLH